MWIGSIFFEKRMALVPLEVRMHVVQQLGLEAHLGAHVLEHRRNGLDVLILIEGAAPW